MHRLIALVATLLLSASALAHAPRASVAALPFGEPTQAAQRIENRQPDRLVESAAPELHAQGKTPRQQKTAHRAHARRKHAESARASALTHCLVLESWLFGWKCASGEVIDGDPMMPVTLNEYLAMHGNPTGVVDPDGRCGVAAAAMQGMGFGAVCDVVDSYMIGTDNREAIKEYRLGSGVGAIRSAVEGVIGGVQLAGDLAMVGRMSPMTAEKLAAMNRVGAVGAGIAEVASDPSLALTNYADDRTTRFRSAVATQQYGKAGEVMGQTQLEVGGAGTGIAGGARTAAGIATRGANKIRAALNGNTPSVLGEAPNGQISSELADDLGQFERDMPTGRGGADVPHVDVDVPYGSGIKKQGFAWEDYRAGEQATENRLPAGTATFDFYDLQTRVATSAKTLDTQTLSRLAKPDQVRSALRPYVRATADFEKARLLGTDDVLSAADIDRRVIDLAVPKGTTAEQWQHIRRVIDAAREQGVEVRVSTTNTGG